MKEALEQAEDYIRDYEAQLLVSLICDVTEKQQRALKCNCPNCTREYESAVRAVDNEWMRQLPEEKARLYAIFTK